MGFSEFLIYLVLPYLPFYLIILGITSVCFCLLYKQLLVSYFEVFYLWTIIFGEIFSITDVIFLYLKGLIYSYYFYNFIITTIILYLTIFGCHYFFDFRGIYESRLKYSVFASEKRKKDVGIIKYYSILLFFIYIIFVILKAKMLGVGRESFVKKGGGSGGIVRILWAIGDVMNYSIVVLFFTKYKKNAVFMILILIGSALLANSKSAVLSLMFLFFFYVFMNPFDLEAIKFVKKNALKLFLIGFAGGITVLCLMTGENIFTSFLGILYRFIAFGDIYSWCYPNNVLYKLYGDGNVSFFHFLTSDFFTTFRMADRTYSDVVNLSGDVVRFIAGPGIAEGPNARFNVAGLAFFGYGGSLLFSVLTGIIFSFVHINLIRNINAPYRSQIFAVFLMYLCSVEQDSSLIYQFPTEFVFFCIIYLGLYCIEYATRKNNQKYSGSYSVSRLFNIRLSS